MDYYFEWNKQNSYAALTVYMLCVNMASEYAL